MSSAVSLRIVEAIVGLGHALVAGDHERGAVVVVGVTGCFKFGELLEVQRKWKGVKAIGWRVAKIVLHR